jgi:uncharacterized OsmC-like protein
VYLKFTGVDRELSVSTVGTLVVFPRRRTRLASPRATDDKTRMTRNKLYPGQRAGDTQGSVNMSSTTTNETVQRTEIVNGINVSALRQTMGAVRADPSVAKTHWQVKTDWLGGTVSRTRVDGCGIGGQQIDRRFEFVSDEPHELCGTNTAANPQEYLLGALNACMTVGYVAAASLHEVELESLQIESEGDIDLRGFLGLAQVPAGYDEIRYTIRVKGNGTPEQMKKIHETVMATSPNRFNLSQPIKLVANLVVENGR